ncbi:MAG: N-acetyl-gamma-glutamyl-phosphate reductase [Rickettsiales bacterium]|nr:N-acetyl-gamma-glutamyl-phosphate reductase [Rickettsiales bacterium]
MDKHITIAILGASGYTGAELIRLLLSHPNASIKALTGDSQAGKHMAEVYPHLRFKNLPRLVKHEELDYAGIDLVFCCLPHGTTQTVIAALPKHVRIVDLSADFRLESPEAYAKWYGHPHQAVSLQKEAVYGLPELAREQVKTARIVANPGCYPTSATLPLAPLLKAGLIAHDGIIIDAKSGVTGAGRAAKQANLFTEVNDGINAYGIGTHRHTPEIEQTLSRAAGKGIHVTFTPHLMPMNRGILSTIYVKLSPGKTAADLRKELENTYAQEAFTHVLPAGAAPSTHMVRGTNDCFIGVFDSAVEGQAILVSAIDNLVKGASGQAVHNMNLMFGLPEATGLNLTAVFP